MKRIGIVGSRRCNGTEDCRRMHAAFDNLYEKGDSIVSGGCPKGADRFAERLASNLGIPITIHRADWSKYGRSAGPRRNTLIAETCDVLIAVVAEDRNGGTEDTIRKVQALGKPVVLVERPGTSGIELERETV